MNGKPSGRWRLTDAQVAHILAVAQHRSNIMKQLHELPTVDELAARLGVNPSTIFRILANGNKTPPPSHSGVTLAKELVAG